MAEKEKSQYWFEKKMILLLLHEINEATEPVKKNSFRNRTENRINPKTLAEHCRTLQSEDLIEDEDGILSITEQGRKFGEILKEIVDQFSPRILELLERCANVQMIEIFKANPGPIIQMRFREQDIVPNTIQLNMDLYKELELVQESKNETQKAYQLTEKGIKYAEKLEKILQFVTETKQQEEKWMDLTTQILGGQESIEVTQNPTIKYPFKILKMGYEYSKFSHRQRDMRISLGCLNKIFLGSVNWLYAMYFCAEKEQEKVYAFLLDHYYSTVDHNGDCLFLLWLIDRESARKLVLQALPVKEKLDFYLDSIFKIMPKWRNILKENNILEIMALTEKWISINPDYLKSGVELLEKIKKPDRSNRSKLEEEYKHFKQIRRLYLDFGFLSDEQKTALFKALLQDLVNLTTSIKEPYHSDIRTFRLIREEEGDGYYPPYSEELTLFYALIPSLSISCQSIIQQLFERIEFWSEKNSPIDQKLTEWDPQFVQKHWIQLLEHAVQYFQTKPPKYPPNDREIREYEWHIQRALEKLNLNTPQALLVALIDSANPQIRQKVKELMQNTLKK